jgi:hypothetical protein
MRNIKDFHKIRLDSDLLPQSPTGQLVMGLVAHQNAHFGGRFDNATVGNAGLFLLRQLQHVRSEVKKVEYPEHKALSFMPTATDIPASVSQYVYFVRDRAGKTRVQNSNAKGPLPRLDVTSAELSGRVVSIEGCYGWTIDELREAARLQIDLPSAKAENARDIVERDTDEILRTAQLTNPSGQTQTIDGIGGFCNNANVIKCDGAGWVTADGTSLTAPAVSAWFNPATTAEQIIADLTAQDNFIVLASKGVVMPDTRVMAVSLVNLLSSRKMSTASDTTVLQYYLKNSPYIKNIEPWIYLDDGNGPQTSGYHRTISYKRDKSVLEAVVPLPFEQFAAQVEGFEFTIPVRAKVGGVKLYQPLGMLYADVSIATS